jgi:hypothetical protein
MSSSGSGSAPRATRTPTPTPDAGQTPTPGLPKQSFVPPSGPSQPPQGAAQKLPQVSDELPTFTLGSDFADLQQVLGPLMGDPIDAAHGTPDSVGCDDEEQRTTAGLAYLRCGPGVAAFAADPDDLYHWAWLGDHLAAWIGPQVDPPDTAIDLPVCVGPATGPETACPLRMDLAVAGFLREPGQIDAYRFSIADPSTEVAADLTNLPADYDLYLVDSSGDIRDQSNQEGSLPEHIEQVLPPGTYYLYVQVDPGRNANPTQAYTLQLSRAQPAAAEPTATDAARDQ